MSRTGMPVARSLVIVDSQSRSRSLNRRRPSLPRSMGGSRPMRSYQRRVCWDRPHFSAASPMVQVVTIRAYELERALTQMTSLAGTGTVEGDGDVLEAEGGEHTLEHPLGVPLRLGQQRALLGGGLDLLLSQDVDLLLAVRIAREEVPDPVEQALLLRVHVGLRDVEDGRFQLGLRQDDRDRGAGRVDRDGLALQLGEVDERDVGALTNEQRLAAREERRQQRRALGQVDHDLERAAG